MSEPKVACGWCKFSVYERPHVYECRRFPPYRQGFAQVAVNDWCGEFLAADAFNGDEELEEWCASNEPVTSQAPS